MNRLSRIEPEFVEFMPVTLEPGVLYISMEYRTTAHLCASGCGEKVTLPLHPGQWSLYFDGEQVSLAPSVGNASLPCRSHYFIRENRIDWARPLSVQQGLAGQRRDQAAIEAFEGKRAAETAQQAPWWKRIFGWK